MSRPRRPRGTKVGRGVLMMAGVLVAGVLASPAHACRCKPPATRAAAYREAVAVVVAQVAAVEQRPDIDGLAATVHVAEAWKASVAPTTSVVSGTTCRFEMQPGETYLLYLTRDPKMLRPQDREGYATAICLGNVRRADGAKAIQWLRERGHSMPIR
jgi:hypothetical protein